MKLTIFLIALVVANYVMNEGYPTVAWAIILIAFWEAFFRSWLRAGRRVWQKRRG